MKRLLVVVDYQNDFISGSLGFEGADAIEDNIVNLIKEFEASGDDIVFTFDTHGEDYMSTVEGKNLPVIHCIKGTEGYDLSKKVKPYLKDYPTFDKPAFGSLELGNYIRSKNYDEIYLCGLESDICVFSNAIIAKSAASIKTEIIVCKDATSSYDLAMQEKSFDVLRHLHIIIK
ncbi:MAG: cysteine hydrolase [Bacilli bacterium]|nr:cysteine hydrolase [Bacilli bacterium]